MSLYVVAEQLLSGKARAANGNKKSMPSWRWGFTWRSNIRRTNPMKTAAKTMVSHRSQLKGFKNIHMFLSLSGSTLTTITTPDSKYGSEKSAVISRSALIVKSPTSASYFGVYTYIYLD